MVTFSTMTGNINILSKELCKHSKRVACIESQHNNSESTTIGEDIFAPANIAALNDCYAYNNMRHG